MCWKNNFANAGPFSVDEEGIRRTIFENWSAKTTIQSKPEVVRGRFVIMSRLTILQHAAGTGSGDTIALDADGFFMIWQE